MYVFIAEMVKILMLKNNFCSNFQFDKKFSVHIYIFIYFFLSDCVFIQS